VLLTCQAGFEALLARELTELHGMTPVEQGPGWVRQAEGAALPDLTFAHLTLVAPG
jgi:hypothetical protein